MWTLVTRSIIKFEFRDVRWHPFQKVTSHYSTENFSCIKSDKSVPISLCAIKLLRVTENSSSGEKVWLLYWKSCRSVLVPRRRSLRPQRPEEECWSSRTQGERILGGGTGGREVLDDGGRPAERIKDRTFLSGWPLTLSLLLLLPANLRACCEEQQGILGKTGGGLFLNTNNICLYVWERERRTCIQAHIYNYWILAQITNWNLFYDHSRMIGSLVSLFGPFVENWLSVCAGYPLGMVVEFYELVSL